MEKKTKILISIIGALILAGAFFACIYFSVKDDIAVRKIIVCTVNEHEINRVEYEYYYNVYYQNYLNEFSFLFDYMGVDDKTPLEEQEYENGKTYKDVFTEGTYIQIVQSYALYDDGLKNGFEYDTKSAYERYLDTVESSLSGTGKSLDDYFHKYYGPYIRKKDVKTYMMKDFYSTAYRKSLEEKLGSDEAFTYIEELVSNYKLVIK